MEDYIKVLFKTSWMKIFENQKRDDIYDHYTGLVDVKLVEKVLKDLEINLLHFAVAEKSKSGK